MIQPPKLIKIIAIMKTEFSVQPHVFDELLGEIKGDGFLDRFHRKLYATDASIYREEPLGVVFPRDRKSTRLNSSHVAISYAVFCLKKKKRIKFILLSIVGIS